MWSLKKPGLFFGKKEQSIFKGEKEKKLTYYILLLCNGCGWALDQITLKHFNFTLPPPPFFYQVCFPWAFPSQKIFSQGPFCIITMEQKNLIKSSPQKNFFGLSATIQRLCISKLHREFWMVKKQFERKNGEEIFVSKKKQQQFDIKNTEQICLIWLQLSTSPFCNPFPLLHKVYEKLKDSFFPDEDTERGTKPKSPTREFLMPFKYPYSSTKKQFFMEQRKDYVFRLPQSTFCNLRCTFWINICGKRQLCLLLHKNVLKYHLSILKWRIPPSLLSYTFYIMENIAKEKKSLPMLH